MANDTLRVLADFSDRSGRLLWRSLLALVGTAVVCVAGPQHTPQHKDDSRTVLTGDKDRAGSPAERTPVPEGTPGPNREDPTRPARPAQTRLALSQNHSFVVDGTLGAEKTPAPRSGANSDACVACHRFETGLSHPVNVAPSMSVPEGWKLESGKVACLTCHDEAAAEPDHARHTSNSLLRADARTMCSQCHTGDAGSSHSAMNGWAHLTATSAKTARAGRAGDGMLDAESSMCVSCHDGTIAGDIGSHLGRLSATAAESGEHPIGIKYGRHPAPGEEKITLVSRAGLDPRVRLFGESVGCGSCHSVYSKNDHLLVMNNYRSKLCLACHVQ